MTIAQSQIEVRLKQWRHALEAAKKEPTTEAIHQLRVSMRRLRQALRAFSTSIDAEAHNKMDKLLRHLLRRCGAVRDCDIGRKLLHQAGFNKSSSAMRHLEQLRKVAERELIAALQDSSGEIALPTADSPPDHLDDPLPRLVEEFFRSGRAATAPDASHKKMHKFRLNAKHFRYTVELFEPYIEESAFTAVLAPLRQLQDRLGNLNDCVTSLELLHKHKRAAAAIEGLIPQRERAFRSYWKRHFGPKREALWTSTFSVTARRKPVRQISMKRHVA
jgi:CHAD domain-containing protein